MNISKEFTKSASTIALLAAFSYVTYTIDPRLFAAAAAYAGVATALTYNNGPRQ